MKTRGLRVLLALLAVPTPCCGYELLTHQNLATQAFLGSRLTSDQTLRDAVRLDLAVSLPGKRSVNVPRLLVREGARLEDLDPSEKRVINHFFDPVHPDLRIAPGACLSPDFALGDPPSAPGPLGELYDTKDSYEDARTYLFQALTAPTRVDRDAKLGRMFVSIGQVIHHLFRTWHSRSTREMTATPAGGRTRYSGRRACTRRLWRRHSAAHTGRGSGERSPGGARRTVRDLPASVCVGVRHGFLGLPRSDERG